MSSSAITSSCSSLPHSHVLQLLHSGRQTQRLHSLVARRVWLDMHVKNSDGPQQLPYPHTPSGVQCMRIMWLVTTARPLLFIQCVISLSLASIAAPPLIVSRVTGFRLSIAYIVWVLSWCLASSERWQSVCYNNSLIHKSFRISDHAKS